MSHAELRRCLELTEDDVRIRIRAQPGARRSQIVGWHSDANNPNQSLELKVKVQAPPIDGAANEALLELLGESLGIAPSHLQLVRGEKSRSKIFSITPARGCTSQQLFEKILESLSLAISADP